MQVRDHFQDGDHFAAAEARVLALMARRRELVAAGRVPPERVELVGQRRCEDLIDLVEVRYSAGVDLEDLAPEVRWVLDLSEGHRLKVGHVLRVSCFALLLGVADLDEVHRLFWDHQVGVSGQRRSVTDWVLGHDARQSPPELYWDMEHGRPRAGWRVIEAAEAGTGLEEALRQFVADDWKHEALDGTFLDRKADSYGGFWCFEGAVMAIRLGIEDTLLRGHVLWPEDLVDAARSATVFPRTSDRDYEAPMLAVNP